MKKVFTKSSDVIHLFANQLQSEARCSNVFFSNERNFDNRNESEFATKIYSYGYHYLLAEFIDRNTIVINDDGYSNTTAKHINEITQATSHKTRFFKSETDLKRVLYSVKSNARKLINARKPELYISPSLRLFSRLNEFINHTGQKEMLKTIEYKEIQTIIKAIEEDPKNSIDAVIKFEKTRKAKEQRIERAKRKKEVKEFKTYKRNRLTVGGVDYLRISQDGLSVETSQSVKVPIKEAKRLLKLIEIKKIIGEKVNDQFLITAFNGSLKVGCHNIPKEEIEEIKNSL